MARVRVRVRAGPPSSRLVGPLAGLVGEVFARSYWFVSRLAVPVCFGDAVQDLVIQYEVQIRDGAQCGGAYVKVRGRTLSRFFFFFVGCTVTVVVTVVREISEDIPEVVEGELCQA